jgi:hypothetical protein
MDKYFSISKITLKIKEAAMKLVVLKLGRTQ